MTTPFVPHHAIVSADAAAPSRWALVLHGILGSSGNFRSFARRLASARPDWGFVLVDLRMHGQSQGAPPPHSLRSAADDLDALADHLGVTFAGVMGHSFGGKVALAYAAAHPGLERVWVIDAAPGVRRDRGAAVEAVIRLLREVPEPLPSRERFLEIVRERGQPAAIADWLAMNVRRAEDGFRLRLDLDAIEALLEGYFAVDMWPLIERAALASVLSVIVAGRGDAFDEADRARLRAIATRDPRVRAHVIAGAGHWVQVDAPDALFEIIRGELG